MGSCRSDNRRSSSIGGPLLSENRIQRSNRIEDRRVTPPDRCSSSFREYRIKVINSDNKKETIKEIVDNSISDQTISIDYPNDQSNKSDVVTISPIEREFQFGCCTETPDETERATTSPVVGHNRPYFISNQYHSSQQLSHLDGSQQRDENDDSNIESYNDGKNNSGLMLHLRYPHHHHTFSHHSDDDDRTPSEGQFGADDEPNLSDHDEEIVVEDINPILEEVVSQDIGRRASSQEKEGKQSEIERNESSVLIFVYGTLKRGYCNHYNLESTGISFFQDAMTIHPYVMYIDSTNRSRPCLTDGSACPIDRLVNCSFDENVVDRDSTSLNVSKSKVQNVRNSFSIESVSSPRDEKLVCPFCCFRQQEHQRRTEGPIEHHQKAIETPTTEYPSLSSSSSSQQQPPVQMLSSKAWGLPVKGELYRIDASLLPALDRFERVPSHYVRQTIAVKGLKDGEYYQAEVYFNNTSSQRWVELLGGRFRILMNYTLDHHRLYQPRDGNPVGQQRKSIVVKSLLDELRQNNDHRHIVHDV